MAAVSGTGWHKARKAAPYALGLAVGGYFFYLASVLEFSAPGGRIGPELWPKMILGALLATCIYEIVRIVLFDNLRHAAEEATEPPPAVAPPGNLRRVIAGVTAAIAYVNLLDKFGFLLSTILFLAVFGYLGGYRRHVVIWLSSVGGSVVLMFVFMRVVYIALPLGVAPFSACSHAAMSVMGIR